MVDDDRSRELQSLIDRIRKGDRAVAGELVARAYQRLSGLARTILRDSFPWLRDSTETASILNGAAVELLEDLHSAELTPENVGEFFVLAARKMRNALRRRDRRHRANDATPPDEPTDRAPSPEADAMWAEFHAKVETLPEELRRVVDLHYYNGLTQAETAYLLGISQPEVSRRWTRASLLMRPWLPIGKHFAGG